MFEPAEPPPPGYSGRYYVDSRGCIFVRTGSAQTILWVPQVTRDRQPVCGYKPNQQIAGSTGAAAVARPAPAAPATVIRQTNPSPNPAALPKGFAPAWDDGRLNPNRGPRTAEGDAQMATVWSDSVPMLRLGN